jgi:GNAT superfamily N-acetyltransferase
MAGVIEVRPMRPGDEVGAEMAWDDAYRPLLIEHHLPAPPRTPEMTAMVQQRMAYLCTTDPGGSWVAVDGDAVVGVAQAHLRGGVWVLATLGVVPGVQDRGVGRLLLDRSLEYGDRSSPGAIFASPDPRAVHRYVQAGFELHPTVVAYGPVRRMPAPPPEVRVGTVDDLTIVDEVDRTVRGFTRGPDIGHLLGAGCQLLLDEDGGGYAVIRGPRLALLSAADEPTATHLLEAMIIRCPADEVVDVSWITAEQQWAVRALADAGVSLQVHEAVMMRGAWQPTRPYLAHGIFG